MHYLRLPAFAPAHPGPHLPLRQQLRILKRPERHWQAIAAPHHQPQLGPRQRHQQTDFQQWLSPRQRTSAPRNRALGHQEHKRRDPGGVHLGSAFREGAERCEQVCQHRQSGRAGKITCFPGPLGLHSRRGGKPQMTIQFPLFLFSFVHEILPIPHEFIYDQPRTVHSNINLVSDGVSLQSSYSGHASPPASSSTSQ